MPITIYPPKTAAEKKLADKNWRREQEVHRFANRMKHMSTLRSEIIKLTLMTFTPEQRAEAEEACVRG